MPEKNKNKNNSHKGAMLLIICSILTVGIIVGCLFFPEEIFGIIK